jgi:hypothetical protein
MAFDVDREWTSHISNVSRLQKSPPTDGLAVTAGPRPTITSTIAESMKPHSREAARRGRGA